jgi:hypothetical protein
VRESHARRITGWCLLLGLARAAAASPNDTTEIWKHIDEFVVLAPEDAPAGGAPLRNDQPVVIGAADLAMALSKLRVEEGAHDGQSVPLFARDAARRLAVPLSTALSRAAPDQDVLFAIEMDEKAALFGYKPVSVAGRAFYQNGTLQLIIGEVHVTTISPEYKNYPIGYPQPDRRLHPHQTGARAKAAHYDPAARFEIGEGVSLFVQNGTVRPDWLVLNVGLLASSDSGHAALAAAPVGAPGGATVGATGAVGTMPAAAAPSPGAPAANPAPSIEERLLRLKRLREQDLITEEEYKRKRSEILDQL